MKRSIPLTLAAGLGLVTILGSPSIATAASQDYTVIGLSQTTGDVMGGQKLTLTGKGLDGATGVCFGEKCVSPLSSTADRLEVEVPPHHGYQGGQANAIVPDYQPGTVSVAVVIDGQKVDSRQFFDYVVQTPLGRQMSYVIAHWDNYDVSQYNDWNSVGGDCANFASAALFERLGDSAKRSDWYNNYQGWKAAHPTTYDWTDPYGYKNAADGWASPSWAYVPSFSAWADANQNELGFTRSDLNRNQATLARVKVGDIVTLTWNDSASLSMSAYSLTAPEGQGAGLAPETDTVQSSPLALASDLGRDHVMVVTRTVNDAGQRDIQLAGHNNDRNYLSLNAIYQGKPNMTGSIWHLAEDPATTPGVSVNRVQGFDRFESAAAVARTAYPETAPVVMLANSDVFADALSAGPAANKLGGPLLLVQGDEVPAVTKEEIERLQPEKAVIVGGSAVVSAKLEADVKKLMKSEDAVERVSGSDRFETSRKIAEYAFASGASTAFIASGERFPDALTLGAAAASAQAPLLLVGGTPSQTDKETAELVETFNVSSIRIAGGTASVHDDTVSALTSVVADTARVYGEDRFLTADEISKNVFSPTTEQAYIVNGMNFPDGLVTSALAGKTKSPIYIAPADCVPQGVFTEITRLGITKITLVGGPNVLTNPIAGLKPCS